MKLIFAGTPEFAACALDALVSARHEIALVLTQPDRPAGRGMKSLMSPVKQRAQRNHIVVLQPATLKAPAVQEHLRQTGADIMIVAAYGLILPQAVLDIPRLGALNIHASLLPRWRGAAPIQRALLAGDRETGICIMRMDAGLDTGPVLMSEPIPVSDTDTAQTLHDRLAALGARLVVSALENIENGALQAQPQPEQGATYAHKINKTEAKIDWYEASAAVDRRIRAFSPFPGAHAEIKGVEIKLWRAAPERAGSSSQPVGPGQVLAAGPQGVVVACGEGVIRLLEMQRPGGKRLAAADFLRGFSIVSGDRFGNSASDSDCI